MKLADGGNNKSRNTQQASAAPSWMYQQGKAPSGPGPGIAAPAKQPSYHSPYKKPSSSSSSGSSGSSGSGNSGYRGGSSSSRSSGSVHSAPKVAAVPTAGQYLKGDTTYQDQIAQLRKAYNDYVASQGNDTTQYQNQYGLNEKDLGTQRTQGLQDVTDDYFSRGLGQSGLYASAYSDAQSNYDRRQTQLDTDRTSFLNDLATNLSNFKGDQATATTSAKQEALARRAAGLGA